MTQSGGHACDINQIPSTAAQKNTASAAATGQLETIQCTPLQQEFPSALKQAETPVAEKRIPLDLGSLSSLHYRILWGLCDNGGTYHCRLLDVLYDATQILSDKTEWSRSKRMGVGCKQAMIDAITCCNEGSVPLRAPPNSVF